MTQETSKGVLKGTWWKTYIHKTQIKGRSNWGLGENALYFRGLMECMRQVLTSCEERRDALPYIEQYDWDETKLNEINQAIGEAGLKMQKHNRLGLIIKGQDSPDPVDVDAYERRAVEIGFLREKITCQKGKVAWLIARDVVDHAVRHHCGMMKMEDLGFVQEAYGSKWAHGLVRQRLEERARAFGITVEVVPARGSSRLDPFTLESVTPRSDRSVTTSGGVMDRDDVASLNLASRKSTRACRALKRKTGSPVKAGGQGRLSRDRRKVTATPKRARPVFGKSRVRLLIKSFDSGGLRSVTVAVDCGSALDHNGLAARASLGTGPRWVCDGTA